MHKRLMIFWSNNSILFDNQFGYSGKITLYTSYVLMEITEEI